ncbi:hypothetical protein DAMA08_007310 [Martiniozyma asiatica (nom. inval.)]|nr:hypothetical protein DAMA08_007310 [Martiniozyma asiatica]
MFQVFFQVMKLLQMIPRHILQEKGYIWLFANEYAHARFLLNDKKKMIMKSIGPTIRAYVTSMASFIFSCPTGFKH